MRFRHIGKQEAGGNGPRGARGQARARLLRLCAPLLLLGGSLILLLVSQQPALAKSAARSAGSGPVPPLPVRLGANWYGAAPYVMVGGSAITPPQDPTHPDQPHSLINAEIQAGAKAFTLAFMMAGNGCTPAWDGTSSISTDTEMAQIIRIIRGIAGDVVVSFTADQNSGYGLARACGTPQATAAAEQQVIDQYGLYAIDFDLEGAEFQNAAVIKTELAAAQILQKNNPGLYESITIPGTTSGVDATGQQLLDEARALNYTPNNFSIMPFDGGFTNGAQSQIAALQGLNASLMKTFGWNSATAYAHEGLSGMNGRTDAGEYFSQKDFETVLNFALQNHLGRYTFWSLDRDTQCNPPNNNNQVSSSCSGVPQQDWDFTKIIVQFARGVADQPLCQFQTVPNPDPLTGLPSTFPTAVDQFCTVPVPGCAPPSAGAPDANDWLFGSTNGLLRATHAIDTYGSNLVQTLWGTFYGLALALLALPFALAGLQLVRGAAGSGRVNVVESLGRILLAAFGAGLLWFAIRMVIDIESMFAQDVFAVIPPPKVVVFMPSVSWSCNAHQFFGNIFNLTVYHDKLTSLIFDTNADKQTYIQASANTTDSLVSNLGNYVLTLFSVLLALQLFIRLALLNVYIILSPVTVICSALGGRSGADVTRAWIRDFLLLLSVQVVQLLTLWLGSQLIPAALLNVSGGDWLNELFAKIIPAIILGITLSIPRLLKSPATSLLTTATSSIGGAITGVVLIIRGV